MDVGVCGLGGFSSKIIKRIELNNNMTIIYGYHPDIHKAKGLIYFGKNDNDKARHHFSEAINIIERIRRTATGNVRRDYLEAQINLYRFLAKTYMDLDRKSVV